MHFLTSVLFEHLLFYFRQLGLGFRIDNVVNEITWSGRSKKFSLWSCYSPVDGSNAVSTCMPTAVKLRRRRRRTKTRRRRRRSATPRWRWNDDIISTRRAKHWGGGKRSRAHWCLYELAAYGSSSTSHEQLDSDHKCLSPRCSVTFRASWAPTRTSERYEWTARDTSCKAAISIPSQRQLGSG